MGCLKLTYRTNYTALKVVQGGLYASEKGCADAYRYGFNGQEKSDDIFEGSTTALFWEYDSRTGRRWNVDPVVKEMESGYATFRDNPSVLNDVKGDRPNDRIYLDKKGKEIAREKTKDNYDQYLTVVKGNLSVTIDENGVQWLNSTEDIQFRLDKIVYHSRHSQKEIAKRKIKKAQSSSQRPVNTKILPANGTNKNTDVVKPIIEISEVASETSNSQCTTSSENKNTSIIDGIVDKADKAEDAYSLGKEGTEALSVGTQVVANKATGKKAMENVLTNALGHSKLAKGIRGVTTVIDIGADTHQGKWHKVAVKGAWMLAEKPLLSVPGGVAVVIAVNIVFALADFYDWW
jgi:hypothetical protein